MDIGTQFNMIAKEYDAKRKIFIPCFQDFYEGATDFILSNYGEPKSVVDLGAGTGLLTGFWYQKCRSTSFTLVDIAKDMLDVARLRFEGDDRVRCLVGDYTQSLPEGDFDVVISALSIHHLEDEEKKRLFETVYDMLPKGGMLVNYDQFSAGDSVLNEWYDKTWVAKLQQSILTEHDIQLWQQRRLLDKECSVEIETAMLKSCNFDTVKCVYSNQKFAVIVAIK
ncbi:MAG: class I SAM-dependent methyltransferase [Christensenellales bacterium]